MDETEERAARAGYQRSTARLASVGEGVEITRAQQVPRAAAACVALLSSASDEPVTEVPIADHFVNLCMVADDDARCP